MSFNASFQDLKNIFNNNICVSDIAESLISFDSEKPAKTVKKFIIEKEFTVVGLRRNGEIEGYVKKDNLLDDGTIDSFSKNIDYEISENAGMMEAFNKLKENDYYFVKILNKYGGIVTRSDIEEIPFRLWVYGTISIFEIILLDIIRSNYSNNEITDPLTENRIKLAKDIFNGRQRKDYAIDFSYTEAYFHFYRNSTEKPIISISKKKSRRSKINNFELHQGYNKFLFNTSLDNLFSYLKRKNLKLVKK